VVLRGFLDPAQLAEARAEADASCTARLARPAGVHLDGKGEGEGEGAFFGVLKGLERDSAYFEQQIHRGRHTTLVRTPSTPTPSPFRAPHKPLLGSRRLPATEMESL
jgi:hypothetical protein